MIHRLIVGAILTTFAIICVPKESVWIFYMVVGVVFLAAYFFGEQDEPTPKVTKGGGK